MIPWIIHSSIISFILIFLIHYLFTFFKDNLTVPKVIDLVNRPKEQYQDLHKNKNISNDSYPAISTPVINAPDISNMKNELKKYLNDLKAPQLSEPTYMNKDSNYAPF